MLGVAMDDGQVLLIERDGLEFRLHVFRLPSGLRGDLYFGDEKVAGQRIYHSDDVERLRDQVLRDAAFQRAVRRLSEEGRA